MYSSLLGRSIPERFIKIQQIAQNIPRKGFREIAILVWNSYMFGVRIEIDEYVMGEIKLFSKGTKLAPYTSFISEKRAIDFRILRINFLTKRDLTNKLSDYVEEGDENLRREIHLCPGGTQAQAQ